MCRLIVKCVFFSEIDLDRAKQDLRAIKHNAKLQAEVVATKLNLLKKKLARDSQFRNLRFPLTQLPDSGCHSPVEPLSKLSFLFDAQFLNQNFQVFQKNIE